MAQIETRHENGGYVYTKRTRMVFTLRRTITRKKEDELSTDLVIATTNTWPEPTKKDIDEIRAALIKRYPDRKLFADTTEGLVPIYEPA